MFPAIVFGLAILFSWWAVNAFVTALRLDSELRHKILTTGEKKSLSKRVDEKAGLSIIVDIAAAVLWVVFYYLTH